MNRTDKDYQAIASRINRDNHFLQSSSMEVTDIRDGYARVEMVIDEKILNIYGLVHGGACFPWPIPPRELPALPPAGTA